MKKLSPNVTDGELMELFREAAINYKPPCSPHEKEELWGRIRLYNTSPYPERTGKKFLSWLSIMLVVTFLGISIRMGESMLPMIKGHQLRTPDLALDNGRNAFVRQREPILSNTTYVTGVPADNRTENEWRNGGEEGQRGRSIVSGIPEISSGQSLPTIRRDTLTEEREKQVWSELPAARRDVQTTVEPPVVSKTQSVAGQKGWSIGTTLGTDWSRVNNGPAGRMGLDGGVLAQYRFARRWSAEIGLSIASKIYGASPQDYHAPSPYPGLLSVDARCRVLDMPINLRYDLMQKGRSMLFASSGLSSYWMQKEAYAYNSEVNGAWYYSKMTIYNKNRYFLSIANFAVGYEYAWNRFSIQASPYIQLPFTGIGYGKVDLVSTGILLSIKRRL